MGVPRGILRGKKEAIRRDSLGVLRHVGTPNCSPSLPAGAVPPLVALAAGGGASPCLQSAVRALRCLADTTQHRAALVQQGAVHPVASCLGAGDPPLVAAAARALLELTRGCTRACAQQLSAGGALPPLVALACAEKKSLQDAALGALANACLQGMLRPALGSAGAVEAVVSAVAQRRPPPAALVRALCLLCREAVNRARVRAAGGLGTMLALLRDPCQAWCHGRVVGALVAFFYDHEAMEDLEAGGLVPLLVAMVAAQGRAPPGDANCRRQRREEVEEEQDEDGPDAASADYPEEPGREAAVEGESPSFQSLRWAGPGHRGSRGDRGTGRVGSLGWGGGWTSGFSVCDPNPPCRSWLLSEGVIASPGDVSPPQWSPDRSLSPVLDLPGVEPEVGPAPPALTSVRNPLEMTSPVLVLPRPRLPSDLLLAPVSSRKRLSSHLTSQQLPPGDPTVTSSSSWQLPPSDVTAMSSSLQQAPPNDLMVMSSSRQPPPDNLTTVSSSRQPPPDDLTAMSSLRQPPPGDLTVTLSSSQQSPPGDLTATLSQQLSSPIDLTATSSSSEQLPPSDLTVMLSSQQPLPSDLTVTSSLAQQPPPSDLTATPSLRQLPALVLPQPPEALPLPPRLAPPPPLGWEPPGEGWGGPEGPALLLLSRYSQAATPARGLVTGPALRGLLEYVTEAPAPSPRGRRLLQRLARHPACLEPLVRCRAPGLLRAWLILGLRPRSTEGPGSPGEELDVPGSPGEEVEEPGSPGEGPGSPGRAPEGPRSPAEGPGSPDRVSKRARSPGTEVQEPRSPGRVPKKPRHLAEGPRSPGEALEEPRSPVPRFEEFGESQTPGCSGRGFAGLQGGGGGESRGGCFSLTSFPAPPQGSRCCWACG